MKKLVRSLEFDPAAFEDLAWWVQNDRKTAMRLIRLIQETRQDPFGGIGKPEPSNMSYPVVSRGGLTRRTDWFIRFRRTRLEFSHVAITTDLQLISRDTALMKDHLQITLHIHCHNLPGNTFIQSLGSYPCLT